MARRSLYLVALALAAPYLYDRYVALSSILANRPGKLVKVNTFKSHEVLFKDYVRNCEDVLMEESLGVAFVSCDPGRDRWNTVMGTFLPPNDDSRKGETDDAHIWVYSYAHPSQPGIHAVDFANFDKDFHPLGIEFDAATSPPTLYVINHSRDSGSVIEVFHYTSGVATHIKTFKHPLIHSPNSIQSLGNGKLLVTNDHYMRAAISPLLSKIETFAGIPGGSVVYTDIYAPEDTKELAHIPFANGIALLNATTVAVASSAKSGVYFYTLDRTARSLKFRKLLRTPSAVDNISVDSAGKLLLAGHPFAPSLMKVAEGRANCNVHGTEEEQKPCACTAPSWVAEWSEAEGLRDVYKDDGEEFCSSSTFARDAGRGVGIVSGLYEKGILVVKS